MKKLGFVDICGIPYEIEERTIHEDPELSDCYGYTEHALQLIVVRAGLGPELFRNVIIHEAQHGIWEHSGLKQMGEIGEELHIQIFTPHLIAFLRSMKKLRVS